MGLIGFLASDWGERIDHVDTDLMIGADVLETVIIENI